MRNQVTPDGINHNRRITSLHGIEIDVENLPIKGTEINRRKHQPIYHQRYAWSRRINPQSAHQQHQERLHWYRIHNHRKNPQCFLHFNECYEKKEMILIHHSTGCHLGVTHVNNSNDFVIKPPKFSRNLRKTENGWLGSQWPNRSTNTATKESNHSPDSESTDPDRIQWYLPRTQLD